MALFHITIEKVIVRQDEEIKHLLHSIISKLNNMPTKSEFDAAFAEVTSGLTNIGEDIQKLTDQLANGGLTPEEEADVFTQLRAAADKIKSLAEIVPGN